jgi:UDP-N-acetylmuramoyl-tripeptide--D-alanyl-D-alanine ligase
MMTLAQVADWTGGWTRGEARLAGVSTDSRRLEPGSLFVALRGERFDGHDHLAEAGEAGAAAVLVEDGTDPAGLPAVWVPDTGQGLLDLAAGWRRRQGARVAAITGSCGKTTVKDMLAAVLAESVGEGALATRGNLNNTVGLPLTLLRLRAEHRLAAVELGINQPGEMDRLAAAAQPDVAVITNAGAAHLEGLGSVAAVAAEKGRLLAALGPGGVAVINADSPFADEWTDVAPGPVLRFGLEAPADLRGEWRPEAEGGRLWLRTAEAEAELHLALPGRHNATNALAAAGAALALGIPLATVAEGLARVTPPVGRLQVRGGPGGATILDDTYNANPGSLEAALAVLAEGPGRTWLVLGDMGELGTEGEQWHHRAGERARELGIRRLLAVGPLASRAAAAFGARGHAVEDWEGAAEVLEEEAGSGDRILIKGSRAMRLERLVARLTGEG